MARLALPISFSPSEVSFTDRAPAGDDGAGATRERFLQLSLAEVTQRLTEYCKTAYPERALPEWNRLNALPGFIRRIYAQVE